MSGRMLCRFCGLGFASISSIVGSDGKLPGVPPSASRGASGGIKDSGRPMSEQLAKQQLLNNIPVLVQLGVPPGELLKEIIQGHGSA